MPKKGGSCVDSAESESSSSDDEEDEEDRGRKRRKADDSGGKKKKRKARSPSPSPSRPPAPWLAGGDRGRLDPDVEVSLFAAWARPTREERRARASLAKRVGGVARRLWHNATCEVFGSTVTGADWFLSDLDLKVEANEPMTYLSPARACEDLEAALKNVGWARRLEARPRARVPIVCFDDAVSGASVDVAFGDDGGGDGCPLKAFAPRFPGVQNDAMIFLKAWLRANDLDKPFTGGLGSFRCGALLDSFLKKRHGRADWKYGADPMIAAFFDYCATGFDVHRDRVTLRHGGRSATVSYGGVDKSRFYAACVASRDAERLFDACLDVGALAASRSEKQALAADLCRTALDGARVPPPPSYEPAPGYEHDLFGRD